MTPTRKGDSMPMEDQLGPLVKKAEGAWDTFRSARTVANDVDEAVKSFFFRKNVILTGWTTHLLSGGTAHPRRVQLTDRPAFVRSVSYYEHPQYGRQDSLDIRTPDGQQWRLRVTDTQMMLAEERAGSSSSVAVLPGAFGALYPTREFDPRHQAGVNSFINTGI